MCLHLHFNMLTNSSQEQKSNDRRLLYLNVYDSTHVHVFNEFNCCKKKNAVKNVFKLVKGMMKIIFVSLKLIYRVISVEI